MVKIINDEERPDDTAKKEEKTYKTLKIGKLTRDFEIRQEDIDEEKRTVNLSFSSEEPISRWFGTEILDHDKKSVELRRLKKGGALLIDHDTSNQVGVIEEVTIADDRKGRAVVRFGRSSKAVEIFQDVVDSIRRNTSVGYQIHEMKLIKESDTEGATYKVTKWEPIEISIVSIPADISVGIGRDQSQEQIVQIEISEITKKDKKENVMADEVKVNIEEVKKEASQVERKRVSEIQELGKRFKQDDLARQYIVEGKPVEEFKGILLEKMGAKPINTSDPEIGMSGKDIQNFSIVRAISALTDGTWHREKSFEKECSDAVAKKLGKTPQGFFIPYDVAKERMTRDLIKGAAAAGGYLIATDLLTASFIELLRNRIMTQKLGARIMDGLIGDVAIPKQTGGATAYWVAESGVPTESQQAFGQLGLTPKTVGAFTDISRKLLLQASLDVEALVRDDLSRVIALEIDRAVINGSGVSNQPTGILNTTGIGDVAIGANGGAPTWATIVNLWKEVAKDNADFGTLAYLINSTIAGKLMVTEKATATAQFVIMAFPDVEGITSMAGARAGISEQVPSNLVKGTSLDCSAIIYGNWADVLIAMWGAVDILVDPYTGGAAGTVRVRILKDCDIGIRNAVSFAACKDARDV